MGDRVRGRLARERSEERIARGASACGQGTHPGSIEGIDVPTEGADGIVGLLRILARLFIGHRIEAVILQLEVGGEDDGGAPEAVVRIGNGRGKEILLHFIGVAEGQARLNPRVIGNRLT